MKKRRYLLWLLVLVGLGAIAPSYVRAYRVGGPSDAPSFLEGDRIIVSQAAYDVRLPYTGMVLVSHSRPQRGDVVLFRPPGHDAVVFKRVVGCPGDTVVVRGGHLEVNGVALRYERVDWRRHEPVATRNALGALIEREAGNGPPHLITHTPDGPHAAPRAAVRLATDQYYLLGDNRDNSRDSRDYGAVPRVAIVGKVISAPRSRL